MAGRWTEGFETHQIITQLARKYAISSGSASTNAGRVSGNAASPGNASGLVLVTPSLGVQNTQTFGIGVRIESNDADIANAGNGLYFERGSSEQIHLGFVTQASPARFKVQVLRGTTLLGETGFDYVFGAWHYFELQSVLRTGTNGSFILRYNSAEILNVSGINTAASGSDGSDVFAFRFGANITNNALRLDDFYLVDNTGSVHNDFLGPSLVEGVIVTANGATNQWINDNTGSADVNNFDQVNDDGNSTPDDSGAGGYVRSDTNGNIDLYTMSDLVQTVGTIHFVQVGVQAAMASAGSRTLRHKYRDPDTTVVNGNTFLVDSTTYDEFIQVYNVNPNGSIAWDPTDIDGGQFGVEVVS